MNAPAPDVAEGGISKVAEGTGVSVISGPGEGMGVQVAGNVCGVAVDVGRTSAAGFVGGGNGFAWLPGFK